MGFSRANARFFHQLSHQLPLNGHALTLGVQNLSFAKADLPAELQENLGEKPLDYKSLLLSIGFEQVSSLDVSDYEGADLIGDLNQPRLGFEGQFDAVFDTGTLEHVFHIPNALKNIGSMVKEGGRVIHVLPSSNRLEHGFYMFSPTLFWDYYQANNYVIEKSYLIRNYIENGHYTWELFPFFPSNLDWLSMGKLDGSAYSTVFVARKTAESTDGKVPQQRRASQFWISKSHIQQQLPSQRDINQLSHNVWLMGYSELTPKLVNMLDSCGFSVLGVVDSMKYGFDCMGSKVLHPNEWQQCFESSQSILLCARNTLGEERNQSLLSAMFSEQQCHELAIYFDSDLRQHLNISESYESLISSSNQQSRVMDDALKLPLEAIL